jgi:hypothetical protein
MNLSKLVIETQIVLKDPAILETTIIADLNEGALDTATTVRIPTLITDDTVEVKAGDNSGDLPPDFHRDLLKAYSSTNSKRLNIRTNKAALDALHSEDETGEIDDVAASGTLLLVGPTASADESIDIKYYAKPPTLKNDNDNLDEHIPDNLQKALLCGKAIITRLPQTDNDPDYIKNWLTYYTALIKDAEWELKYRIYPDSQKSRPIRHRKVRTF